MKYAIARHQHGISLNPFEYVLTGPDADDSPVMEFDSKDEAIKFLNENSDAEQTEEEWEEEGIYIRIHPDYEAQAN